MRSVGLLGLVCLGLATSQALGQDGPRALQQAEARSVAEAYRAESSAKRREAITLLEELLQTAEGSRRAEMLLRLGSLTTEEAEERGMLAMARYQEDFDTCFDDPDCDETTLEPDLVSSHRWLGRAMERYEALLTEHPRHERADQALFYLASAHAELGQRDEAALGFERLVNVYTDSEFLPDAYLQLGEHHFEDNEAFQALLHFKRAAALFDSERRGYARYMLAWSQYNVGELPEAIATLKRVVEEDSGRLELREEALDDLVRFYAESGEMAQAIAFFEELGESERIDGALALLAHRLSEQGELDRAVTTWRRLIARNPDGKDNAAHQDAIVKATATLGDPSAQLVEVERLVRTYGKDTSWARLHHAQAEDAADRSERRLRQLALTEHDRGRRLSGNEADASLQRAAKAYALYLQYFEDRPQAYGVRYAHAELLYKLAHYEEAYSEYLAVVALDPKGEHAAFCAESAVFAAEKVVAAEAAEDTEDEIRPLTVWEERLVQSVDDLAVQFPGSRVKPALYKAAYLLYQRGDYDRATDRFQQVIALEPQSAEAELAANLILDSFVLREDYQALRDQALMLSQQVDLGSQSFRDEAHRVYLNASVKLIETRLEASGDQLAAAESLQVFLEEHPDYAERARLLNNAAIYYSAAGDRRRAMVMRTALVEDPTLDSPYAFDQLAALAFDRESIADFSGAAQTWARTFEAWDGEEAGRELAADALLSAGVLARASGDLELALQSRESFLQQFPDDARSPQARVDIAEIHATRGDHDRAIATYEALERAVPDQAVVARAGIAASLRASKRGPEADVLEARTLEAFEPTPETASFLGAMALRKATPTLEALQGIDIAPSSTRTRRDEDRGLAQAMRDKLAALVSAEQAFASVIDTGAAEPGLAALVGLGQSYEDVGDSVLDSHVPTYLTPAQAQDYRQGLKDRAYPLFEKAASAYEAALTRAFELSLYTEATAMASERLAVLRPATFPELREELPEVRVLRDDPIAPIEDSLD